MGKCIVCGKEFNSPPLLKYENMPARAQKMPDLDCADQDEGIELALHQCDYCGLVQLDCTPVEYYREVIRAGGFTKTMVDLRREQYKEFIAANHLEGKKIIEIGAGQGEFLKILEEYDVKAAGLEYSPGLVEIANTNGCRVYRGFAKNENTIIEGAPYNAFVCFNFLEHQPDPNGFVRAIYRNLTPDGCGLVTVPDFRYMIENDGFYELIRDHIAYYTRETLAFLFEKNGFETISDSVVNRDTIALQVKKRSRVDVSGMADNFERLGAQIQNYVKKMQSQKKRIAIWGASHQAFTLLAALKLNGHIAYIIDSAPFKQGKAAPASHVPIVSPEHFSADRVNSIIIAAPGYWEEIAGIIDKQYGEDVHIAVIRSSDLEEIR